MMEQKESCPFCTDRVKDRIMAEKGGMIAIRDEYPVTRGHTLIMPRRHTSDFFTMTKQERSDSEALILQMKNKIMENDPSVTGFNIGVNCGVSAGQSIMHAHIHLIPRRDNDTPFPKGGVRGVIPGKRGY